MAKEESSEVKIIEERIELMVDPTNCKIIQNPTKRTAFFLKPPLSPNALPPKLPKIQSFSSSSKPNVVFLCRTLPLKGWETWVEKLRETHEPAWRKAGIFDAIKGSTYHIRITDNLIYSLVERWCPETNTFVFPWGEATVTLEDVYVLGGFSPLGVSVLSKSSVGENVEFIENELVKIYRELRKFDPNMSHLRWQEHFMGCGNEIEHAGFLALWLARHVFSGKAATVVIHAVFSMAAKLICGAKLAFGPVILASIYRDLTLLKRKIVGSESGHSLRLTSPLHLVHVWAWERFPSLGPVPRIINCGETRLARWEIHLSKLHNDIDHIEMCLDSSRETFKWRPYAMSLANWPLPRFYADEGTWVKNVDSHEGWKLFSRCVMVGQLVGLNCVEEYNPHRVALQFGFDQDIPKSIDRSKASCKLGWLVYKKNLRGLKLYIPPRLHEGDVTRRYFNWWRAGSHSQEEARVGCKRKKRVRKRAKKLSKICDTSNEFDAIDVSGNAREKQTEKSSPREESPARSVLQLCNRTRMTCVFHMKVGSISREDTSIEEDEVMTINQFEAEDIGVRISENPIDKFLPSDEVFSRNVFQIGNNIGINSQEDPSTEEDEIDEVRYINLSMSECSNNSDHRSSRNEVEENEINILCSKLAETKLNTPCEDAVCSDFAAKLQNLANEYGRVRQERGSKNYEVNARDQNEEHNVVEHHMKMEVNTLDSQLAEDELAVTLCEEKDPMNEADIPGGSQPPLSIVGSDFAARHHNLATGVEKSRALSALMRPEGCSKHSEFNDIEQNKEHKVVEHHVKMEVKASGSLLSKGEPDQANIRAGGQLAIGNVDNPLVAICAQFKSRISRLERQFSTLLGTKSKPCIIYID